MTKRPQPVQPPGATPGISELERFSTSTLQAWTALSKDLDELYATLYFGVLPEQRRLRPGLIDALRTQASIDIELRGWVRIVSYRYSQEPLSCAGSLQEIGGRFNAGAELDPGTLAPWPCLYVAEDHETAYREKFQLARADKIGGLTPEELALENGASHTTVLLNGHIQRVFDVTSPTSLEPIARVLRHVKMPGRARSLKEKLKIPKAALRMVQNGTQMHDAFFKSNWRTLPIQFGLPAPSHIIAELIRAAGFEAIVYQSTKGGARCLALFPDCMQDGSFIELADTPPPFVKNRRLDSSSAGDLSGWETISASLRPR